MAAGAITVTNRPATIESDVTPRVITLGNVLQGTIVHKSGDRVFLGFDKAPVTSELQDDGTIFLDAGDAWLIPKGTVVINHRAKTSTAILFFNPALGLK